MMSGVRLEKVVKAFGTTVVVPELTLAVDEGEFVVIVGPSGCGKSTTLRMIAGLEDVTSGRVVIRGRDMTDAPPKARDIAMIFQSYALYPHMNVADNMSFALRLARRPRREIAERVQRAAEMLELTPYLDRKPRDLSGGQRQRVAVGRSIVREAYCFLFDEPLSNLDAKLRATMRTELSLLHKKLERTMIYVTHDQIEAMTMADRIVIMDAGVIQQTGTPREVYSAPDNRFVAEFIGSPSMNMLDGEIAGSDRLRIEGRGFSLPVPDRLAARARRAPRRAVTVGLRPEHFAAADSGAGNHSEIDLEVSVSEYIGSSQFLAATVRGHPVTASVEVGPDAPPMTSGRYYFDVDRLYLFDRASGEAI